MEEVHTPHDVRKKLYTLQQYAHYVLDDPRVDAWIKRFKTYQRVADRIIDACDAYIDTGVVTFDAIEQEAVTRYKKAMERVKNEELERMIEEIHPPYWAHYKLASVARGKTNSPNAPRREDMPLLMMKRFVCDQHFRDYLFKGVVPLIAGPYFRDDIDLARQRYTIFALFLWIRTDGCHDFKHGTYSYYEEAISGANTVYLSPRDKVRSTVANRLELLYRFKAFIHFDMWEPADYRRRNKKGEVMRLRLRSYDTGQIVLQQCDGPTHECNEYYLINQEILAHLALRFHSPEEQLTPFALVFRCDYCGKHSASFLTQEHATLQSETTPLFYCDKACFTLKKA